MKSVLIITLVASVSLAYVVKDKTNRISEQKCMEYALNSTFTPNEYQTSNCSLQNHDITDETVGFNPAQFRHLAKIYSENNSTKELICTGALISDQYVLTTAQCVSDQKNIPKWVRLGDNDMKTIQDFTITDIIQHPQFIPSQINHNIALLKLNGTVKFSPQYVVPACLHSVPDVEQQELLLIASWGLRNIDNKEDFELDDCGSPVECRLLKNADANKVFCTQSPLCAWMQIKTGATLQIERNDIWCMHDLVGLNILAEGFTCSVNANINLNIKIFEYIDWIESIVWL